MLRILRAFAWMRWRMFVNSLEKTGSRDVLQRLSTAAEGLAPILVLVVMIPSAIALAGVAGYMGFQLATGGDPAALIRATRALLLVATILALFGPLMMPGAGRVNPVRLLLLPIPARTLYVAQAAGALTDPWILLLLPIVSALPIGLLIGGAAAASVVAACAAVALVATLVGISALATTVFHLLLRDRRRGELVGLVLILVLPVVGFLPTLIRGTARESRVPPWLASAGARTWAIAPSELYTGAMTGAVRTGVGSAIFPLTTLVASGAVVHGVGLLLFRRVLSSPATTGARRVAAKQSVLGRALPGVSPGTSAVATALCRLALRTTRGRSILISPLFLFVFFGFLMLRPGPSPFGPFAAAGGLGIAALTSGIGLISILSLAMNQFAVDRAGLTLTLLSPLSTRQILAGKAIGGALIVMPPALICILISAVVFPGGSPALWLALPLALAATYILTAPAAAMLSAIFPRLVDLNSIGSKSSAHGVAGFVGLLAFAAAGASPVALILLATRVLDRPWLAPCFLLLWCVVALVIARLLFIPAERIFDTRRENLAMLV